MGAANWVKYRINREHHLGGLVVRVLGDELAAEGFGEEGAVELFQVLPQLADRERRHR